MKNSTELEKAAVLDVVQHMAASARTAPKGRGIDNIECFSIDDEATKKRLVEKMLEIAKSDNRPTFDRDSKPLLSCHAILLIGAKDNPAGLNCGLCGYKTCDLLKKSGGMCAFNSMDLGIAAGSAIAIASSFHIDNRLMYSIGKASMDLGLFSKDVRQALGIPLSVTGKNPFFDRK
jgi:uncharacterized ferredoxin-like protein